MRVLKRNPWLTGLGTVLSLLGLWYGTARAATTDEPASVLFFPKVIADGTRDTLIQITNTSNSVVQVHCEYTRANGFCSLSNTVCSLDSECPTGQSCLGVSCQKTQDFEIALTKQQPTFWRVSTGRSLYPSNSFVGQCDPADSRNCPGLFFGQILASDNFRGDMICWEIDDSGAPIGMNAVKGEATIQTLGGRQISEYNAVGFRFLNAALNGNIALDGNEYEACPAAQLIDHYAQRADDLVASAAPAPSCMNAGDCPVTTDLTIVPCSADFEHAVVGPVTAQFVTYNEFENRVSSTGLTLPCWWNGPLDGPGGIYSDLSVGTVGSPLARTQVRPANGFVCTNSGQGFDLANNNLGQVCTSDADCTGGLTCEAQPGILSVVEDFHANSATSILGSAAGNGHFVGARGYCLDANSGLTTTPCTTDLGCPSNQRCAIDSIWPVANP